MSRSLHQIGGFAFEKLVQRLCVLLLGPGVKVYSTGPDNGIDASFLGTATNYPSSTAPWSGRWIVQAKHCENPGATIADPDFSGVADSSTISAEIRALKAAGHSFDHYLLVTNRRSSPKSVMDVEDRLKAELGLQNARVIAQADLDNLLKVFPQLADQPSEEAFQMPLELPLDDVAAAVEVVAEHLGPRLSTRARASKLQRTRLDDKNRQNQVGKELDATYNAALHEDLRAVESFLQSPDRNEDELRDRYWHFCEVAADRLTQARSQNVPMSDFLVQLIATLGSQHQQLRTLTGKRSVRALVYYMYWICDLGTHVDSDET